MGTVAATLQLGRAAAIPSDVTLEPGSAIERQAGRDESHEYRLVLTSDECVNLIVEQRGVDVTVDVRDPEGTSIAAFQSEVRPLGQEHVEVIADRAGTYTLVVAPAEETGVTPEASYAIRVTGRRAATDADRAMRESRRLNAAAAGLRRAGNFVEARALVERALDIGERLRGPDDAYVGALVGDLAGAVLHERDYTRAQSLYQRAAAVLGKSLGADHPAPALMRCRLSMLYGRAGEYPQSLALLEPSIAVIERTLGPAHPWLVRCLVTQANIYDDLRDLDKAEAIGLRAMAILEQLQQTDRITYADLLNNLGLIYRQKKDYARAEACLLRSLAIGEKVWGADSFSVSSALQNLGLVARERQDYATAEAYYLRALTMRERLVPPDHPDLASLVNNLANVHQARGDSARALEMHLRALHIREQTPNHPGLLASVASIARVYAARGEVAHALAFQRRADAIVEQQLTLNIAIGSERQRLALAGSMASRTDRTISLHLYQAPSDPEAGALAALVLLQRKGRVLDAMTDAFASMRQRVADVTDRSLLDRLSATRAQLARLALNEQEGVSPKDREQRIDELETRAERLESELGARSAAFRAHMQPVTLDAVQRSLPDASALVEFVVFRPFDPRADGDAARGPARYAAYVLRRGAPPHGQDLGPADAIDGAVASLREALRDPARTDVRDRARALDEQIMRPLRAALGGATHVLISPDGDLHLVPFEALRDETDRYLIERHAITYLTSGRDLLRMQATRSPRGPSVVLANPLFGEPAVTGADGTRTGASASARPRRSATVDAAAPMYFAPLAATAAEAQAIKALFPEARLLTGRQATKVALQRLDAPRLLHIATHGFFLTDGATEGSAPPAPEAGGTRAVSGSVRVDNPLLRSGLALAGANLPRGAAEAQDPGVLTALEASGLDLWGTKLVTLSACDTGVGEVRNGEGVYGLRRAFTLAGAETLVMSLWPVSDYVARETMIAYYAGLRAGLGRGGALRQAKLAMLKRPGRQHPFFWASFIQSGEWASLDGRR